MSVALAPAVVLVSAMAAPEAVAGDSDDIVVIGRKLDSVTVSMSRDARGRNQCSLSDTTGFREIDAILCRTTAKCIRKGAIEPGALEACFDAARPAIARRMLAAVRKRAQAGGAP